MRGKTHYDVLGLDPKTAELDDIKKAFRKLALQHHPDRVAPEMKEEAAEKFRTIREAFDVLSYGPSKLRYETERRQKNNYRNVAAEDGNYFNKNLVAGRVKKNIDGFSVKRHWCKPATFRKNYYYNYNDTAEDGFCFNKNIVAGRVKKNIDGFSVKRHWRKPATFRKNYYYNYNDTAEDGFCFNKNIVAGRVKKNIDGFSVKRHWRKPATFRKNYNYDDTAEDGFCFNKNLVAGSAKIRPWGSPCNPQATKWRT